MHNEHKEKTMREKVIAAIKEGQTTMRPKWHFILERTLFIIGAVITLLALLYVASFILFTLWQSGLWFAPLFGSRGWFTFFRSLPWVLIALSALFTIILEILVRRYSFAYRKPLLYSLLGVLLIIFIGGSVAAPWHRRFFRAARENRLPRFAGHFYRSFGMPRFGDIHRGIIVAVTSNGFVMERMEGSTSTVIIGPYTRLSFEEHLQKGDMVVVFGEEMGNAIEAYGIKRLNE